MDARPPKKTEIDHRTIKLLVGVFAIALPLLVSWLAAPRDLASISESYHVLDWPRSIFVGFLFAVGAFLAAYNGRSKPEMVCAKVAAVSAFLIALFPCGCGGRDEIIRGVHYAAAAAMFVVLAFFCWKFYERAIGKIHEKPQARVRALVYAACGLVIVVSILCLAINGLLDGKLSQDHPTFVYWFETAGLLAFGISWLTASHVVPGMNAKDEWFWPMRHDNPPG
jgi:hypothetical protein